MLAENLPSKTLWYDWNGANATLFKAINGIRGETYDPVMKIISHVTDYEQFPYYICAMALWVLLNFIWRKVRGQGGARQYLIVWFGVVAVFFSGFAAEAVIIRGIKDHAAFPRPYVALSAQDMRLLETPDSPRDDYRSFPSGHVSYITLVVVSLWPVLNGPMHLLGLIVIFATCWSRLAVGMHFPMDVMSGFLLSMIITIFIRAVIYRILRKFRIRC